MRRNVLEESVLLISILKWSVIATGTGLLVGASTAVFLKILAFSIGSASHYPYYFLAMPVGLFASSVIIHYIAPDARGYGTDRVIEAVHKDTRKFSPFVVPAKLAATVITVASGGSAGQIGPCAQIGAALSSTAAHWFKFDDNDRKKLLLCGISAGFASVLGAPIAGAVFGVEVMVVGGIMYEVLLPSFISGIVGYHTAAALGIPYVHSEIGFVPVFSNSFFAKIILAGVFFGLVAFLMIEMMRFGERQAERLHIWPPLKGILGGCLLIGLTLITSTGHLGLGQGEVRDMLSGSRIVGYTFLLKGVSTSLTFACGGTGGIIMPALFIGAAAGSFFGDLLGLDRATFAAVGFVSVLAGIANTPIASGILAMELFGTEISAYAVVACVVSFLMTGHRSMFPSQVLVMKKSSSIAVDLGTEVGDSKVEVNVRDRSMIGVGARLWRKLRGKDDESP